MYAYSVGLLHIFSCIFGQNSIDKYRFHDVHDLHQRYRIYGCYYHLEMNPLIGDLKGISMDTEQSLYTGQGIDEDDYWNILRKDLDNLKAISTLMNSHLLSYVANKTTKIELSNSIGRHTLSSLERSFDRLISATMSKGLQPLLKKASELGKDMPSWYKEVLGILQMSVPGYEDRGVKFLHIWRHPVALLETEEILNFRYSVFDAWRSWETSTNFANFIVSGNAGRLVVCR